MQERTGIFLFGRTMGGFTWRTPPKQRYRTIFANSSGQSSGAGSLRTSASAHWDRELGAVTEVLYRQKVEKSPMLLFDDIPDYAKGYRCAYGMFGSPYRLSLVLGMEPSFSDNRKEMLDHFRKHTKKGFKRVPPKMVSDGPVLENVMRDGNVDMLKFPVPIHHEDDGGRYIGTGCGVVTRDPDTGRINVGTYRVQVKGPDTCASYISNGKQGRIHRDKYLKAGKPCPVVIIVGCDPVTYLSAGYTMPDTMPEYEWTGGVMGRPAELIEGELTGLPFPARSEIVMEGHISPDETTLEGPFGEWHGYYAGEAQAGAGDPHRSASTTATIPYSRARRARSRRTRICSSAVSCVRRGCSTRSKARASPTSRGAWLHQAGGGRTFCVVSVKQRFFGHSTQVGLVASQVASVGYISRWIVVVDDDVDPTDIQDVIWAMGTRCDPKTRTTILDHCWSSRLDTLVNDYTRLYNTRMVIDACRPYEQLDTFPKVCQSSPELAAKVRAKYPELYR